MMRTAIRSESSVAIGRDLALRIYDGLTAGQWSLIGDHLDPVTLATAQAQATKCAIAEALVRELERVGLLTLDVTDEEHQSHSN